MAYIRDEKETVKITDSVLSAATKLFIENGYERTTVSDIAKLSGVPQTKIFYIMKTKEDILVALTENFLNVVTSISDSASKKLTDNGLFVYAANEVLQIYMAEMNENMRNFYLAGYSMQKTADIALRRRTDMMYDIFGKFAPYLEKKDFYENEIASMGIMRAYMTVPCDMYFTKTAKAEKLVNMLFNVYRIDEKTIAEAVDFIKQIDFESLAEEVIKTLFKEFDI